MLRLPTMTKQNLLISVFLLALFSTFTNNTLSVPSSETNKIHQTLHTVQTTSTMSNSQAPIRGHGRGRAFARGGRGANRGGRIAVNLPEPPRDGGSPISSHLSTFHDTTSVIDDTIELFTHVTLTHQASRSIAVRQKHVENVCRGLNNHIKATKTNKFITSFTPDSLDEQRRHIFVHNNNNRKIIKKHITINTTQTNNDINNYTTNYFYLNLPVKPIT